MGSGEQGATILVADNEGDILRFVEVNLRLEGFEVVLASDGERALELAFARRPDLVLLDVVMPGADGYEVCRRLRADPRTAQVPVIFLTARSMVRDRVAGLGSGADDYVLKPFDPVELVARVRTTLQRVDELRSTSPLTGLPGNHRIQLEIARRLADDLPLAVSYADLSDFKAFNDSYGFLRGDEVILMTAEVLRAALAKYADDEAFLGHIGGDDYMLLCRPDEVRAVCEAVIANFDARVLELYDPEDLDAGYLEVTDRQGHVRRFPVMTIALGVATTERRAFRDPREVVEVATEMKAFLKQSKQRSAYAVDERADPHTARGSADATRPAAG